MRELEERRVDEMTAAHAKWREASRLVDDAYRSWGSDTGLDSGLAFVPPAAALDAEESAAGVYADLVRCIDCFVAVDPQP